jgi:hypothetical protein
MENGKGYNGNNHPTFRSVIPVTGILLFFVFYIISTLFYPGGSNFNQAEDGFNWQTNYWCELLYEYSKNGHINAARPYALTAMASLTISVGYFWFYFPQLLKASEKLCNIVRWSGGVSMVLSSFIFTNFHDSLIYLSVISGSVAYIGLIYMLFRSGHSRYGIYGSICLFLILLNNLIYVVQIGIEYLPIIQKITFLLTLSWILSLSVDHKKLKNQNS